MDVKSFISNINTRASIFSTDEDKIQIVYQTLVEHNQLDIFERIFGVIDKERQLANGDLATIIMLKIMIDRLDKLVDIVKRIEAQIVAIDNKLKKVSNESSKNRSINEV